MLSVIPQDVRTQLTTAIWKGTFEEVRSILEQNAVEVNSFVDEQDYDPLILEAVRAYSLKKEESRTALIGYLLERGADVNRKNKAGYNCLHLAVQDPKLFPLLELFLRHRGDVNEPDATGATATGPFNHFRLGQGRPKKRNA